MKLPPHQTLNERARHRGRRRNSRSAAVAVHPRSVRNAGGRVGQGGHEDDDNDVDNETIHDLTEYSTVPRNHSSHRGGGGRRGPAVPVAISPTMQHSSRRPSKCARQLYSHRPKVNPKLPDSSTPSLAIPLRHFVLSRLPPAARILPNLMWLWRRIALPCGWSPGKTSRTRPNVVLGGGTIGG